MAPMTSPTPVAARRAVVLLGALVCGCRAAPVELLDAGGKLASAREITSLFGGRGGQAVSVVGVVGSRGSGKSTLLNRAFGTEFPEGEVLGKGPVTGVCATAVDGLIILDCDGAEEATGAAAAAPGGQGVATAAQATALSAALSDVTLVNVWRSDLARNVAANVRTLKAVFSQKLQALDGKPESPMPIMVAVHDCDPGADAEAIEAAVVEEAKAVWGEVEGARGALEDYFSVKAVALPHPKYHASAYAAAAKALGSKLLAVKPATASAGFAGRALSAWTAVVDSTAALLPAKSELVAVYKVDAAFSSAMEAADSQLQGWRQAVGEGKVVPKFGDKAGKLYTQCLKTYDSKTVRFSTTPLRATKRAALSSALESGIKDLYARQLAMLSMEAQRAFKKSMVGLLDKDQLADDAEAAVLRKTLFGFEADATMLVPEPLGLGFEEEYEDLEGELYDFSEKFGESPAALAKQMNQVDKITKRKKNRKKGWDVSFNLVGMMKQQGDGGLQGYGGYRMGPHTVTVGYANDLDEEDDDVPLFRVQPKLDFNVDL